MTGSSDSERRERFELALPGGTFLDPGEPEALERYARSSGFLASDETLQSVAKAGEGNMNLTLRLTTSETTLILKQARPWVEKYPTIAAPAERALVEFAYYEAVATRPAVRDAMPRPLGSDPASRVLALEDLGSARDFTGLYRGETLSEGELDSLVSYLLALHPPLELGADQRKLFQNRAMRALNHEHIFHLPLAADNGLDLDAITPGLSEAAGRLKEDRAYVEQVTALGALYLSDGPTLVHGDYFPGSWLRTAKGVRVIDPEFCFLGDAAFDVGVFLAHLYLAEQPEALEKRLFSHYQERGGRDEAFSRLARQFAGVEIMRRIIGVAQLPLTYGIDKKKELLSSSRRLVLPA